MAVHVLVSRPIAIVETATAGVHIADEVLQALLDDRLVLVAFAFLVCVAGS